MLVQRYSALLSSIAFTRLRNPEDARDVVQESFVIAYCTLDRLADPLHFGAWIRGILLNRCRKHIEKRERSERFLSRLPHPSAFGDAHALVESRLRAGELCDALEKLDERRQGGGRLAPVLFGRRRLDSVLRQAMRRNRERT